MFQSISMTDAGTQGVLVFAAFADQPLHESAAKHDVGGLIAAAVARAEFGGKSGAIAEAFLPTPEGEGGKKAKKTKKHPAQATRVLVVGLGKKDKFKPGELRSAAAALAKRLHAAKEPGASLHLAGVLEGVKADLDACGQALGEGFGLIGWDANQFKGKGTEKDKLERRPLALSVKNKQMGAAFARGLGIADAANLTRTLSETPPNIATTSFMADQARALAKECGLGFQVFAGKELERERLVGHVNVGKASENKPCMIRLEYTPKKAKDKARPVVLIGKTVTYDTGGLSLKINNGMVGMKRDKDGGCAVLGAMKAIATVIKPKVPVVAILCCAENSISDEAYRPDDVLTYRNGVTVEITNTDAEGRLVLADGLCWACEKERPRCIIDLATLTGGVVVALGDVFCGMFCEDDDLRAKVEAAAKATGEHVWRLPLNAEYREQMKSPVADILNSNPNRKAHPVQGAAFLSYFVDDKVPWCHLDIAGVHAVEKDTGPFVKGPTAWGVRLLAELIGAM